MALSDPLGDMLTRIRNGLHAHKKAITSPHSKFRASVLQVLTDEGYIRGFEEVEVRKGLKDLRIELKYHNDEPVIKEIARVSKPGRRLYTKIDDLNPIYGGLGVFIVSTPRGVMTDHNARKEHVGGEVLCRVF